MKTLLIAFLWAFCFVVTAMCDEATPYVGVWSNIRGNVLKITKNTIQFQSDNPISYHDITRVTDGNFFHLELDVNDSTNFFQRYIYVEMKNAEEMSLQLFSSEEDHLSGKYSEGKWFRD
jgi:hypothetical protein